MTAIIPWAVARRLDYIDWMLATSGSIRRSDLADLFGVSLNQASIDLNLFIASYPDAMRYDKSEKRYVAARANYGRRRKGPWTHAIDWSAAT